jgi:hypothetical protein
MICGCPGKSTVAQPSGAPAAINTGQGLRYEKPPADFTGP